MHAVPVVVGFGAVWFTTRQGKVADAENKDNQHETALQAYIDKMSELLLHEKLRDSASDDEVRNIARVRTLTVLRGLDPIRKASVLQFLHESGLIDKDKRIINMINADLSEAYLLHAYLPRSNLYGVNMRGATLNLADLSESNLVCADLSGTSLAVANLFETNLSSANLRESYLCEANMRGADLRKAILVLADLRYVNMDGAKVSDDQLKYAKSLKGATMSDGFKQP